MKKFLVFFLLSSLAQASLNTESFFYFRSGRRIEIPIGEQEKIKVNDRCLNKQQKCLALKKLHQKSKIKQLRNAIPGNASGSYCDFLGGVQLLLQRISDNQKTQFCVFSDLSMIDAKELYLRHYEEK